MKQIPTWIRRPATFIVALLCLEPIRWGVGSMLDEAYETYGWRWAKLAAAATDASAMVVYAVITVGFLAVLAWCVRELLRPDAPEQPKSAIPASTDLARSKAPPRAEPAPAIKGTSPAYRKAVLQVKEVKSERQANSSGTITSATCRMVVSNMALQRLDECSVVLGWIENRGLRTEVNEAMRPSAFPLERSQDRHFTLAHRDRTDIVSNPPHILKTSVTDHALAEDEVYMLTFFLRSKYPHQTIVLIELSVPEDPDGAVIGRVVNQDVDRN